MAYGEVFASVGGPVFLLGLVFWVGGWAVATTQTYRYQVEVAGSSSPTAALRAILFAAFTILVPGGFFLWANAHRLARKHDL